MKLFSAALLMLCLAAAPTVFAQSSGTETQEQPPQLNVRPAGIAQQDWEPGLAAVKAVPSPIGPALPGFPMVRIVSGVGAQATLFLDGQYRQYTFDCAEGRCTGFAPDLWKAADGGQRLDYLRAVGDALMQTYPDFPQYTVVVQGKDQHGQPVGANWSWYPARGEFYFFVPAL